MMIFEVYQKTTFYFISFNFLEDIRPFCGAPDTPVLDFW